MTYEYKLLRINLNEKSFSTEEIPEDLLRKYIGGKGLGSKYLIDEIEPNVDPLGPKNKLIIVSGPLTATIFPTANRYGLLYKSPLTGTYAESYSGGGVVQKLRSAGYFTVIIEGKSDKHCVLEINESEVKFNDASSLWGKDTFETYTELKSGRSNETDILCIGPAGENLVRIANVQNNMFHSAGRCGPGAVLGSKNIKAIVFSGKKTPKLNKKPEFKALVKKILKKIRDRPDLYGKDGLYPKYGTPSIVDWTNEYGCFPTRYFTACYSEHYENFNAEALNSQIFKRRSGCWNCPFSCGKHVEVPDGPFKCSIDGPEYETIYAFGGLCDVRDISAIAKLNEFCDRMGIDTMSAGNLCGLAIESKVRKRIPGIENLKINYNNPLELLSFLSDVVNKEGFGKDFAEGTKFVSEKYNLKDFAMHVKGLDFAGYDPRAFRGFALSYGVSPEGPTHLRSTFHGIEIHRPDRFAYENKAAPMMEQEDKMAIIDSLIVCKFLRSVLDWDMLAEIYKVLFDVHITVEELRKIAGHMITTSRLFNIKEGFSRKDDYMPDRVYNEELTCPDGSKINIDRKKYDKMLDEYYKLRGWSENGIPD